MAKRTPAPVVESSPGPIDPYALTPEELARALDRIKIIRNWCDAIEAASIAALVAGQDIPGYRLGFNKPQQKWLDPEQALDACGEIDKLRINDYAPREILPPGKLLTLLKHLKISDKPLKKLITRNEPKLVVTELENTYYDVVNAIDLAAWLARQSATTEATSVAKVPRKKKRRGAK